MDFLSTPEHELLRSSAAEVRRFGHGYFFVQAKSGGKTDELWQAMADHGFLGVHLPEEDGGRGRRGHGTGHCVRGGCRTRLPPPPHLGIRSHLRRADRPFRHHGSEVDMAAGVGHRRQNGVRHHGTGRRLQQPSHLHDGPTRRRHLPANGCQDVISGVEESNQVLVVTRTSHDEVTGRGGLSLFIVDRDAKGLTQPSHPGRDDHPGEAVHDVLRQRRSAQRTDYWEKRTTGCARGSRPQPGAHHRRRHRQRYRFAMPCPRPPASRASGQCGGRPSQRTKELRTHLPRQRSNSNWPD